MPRPAPVTIAIRPSQSFAMQTAYLDRRREINHARAALGAGHLASGATANSSVRD
jgi:hypothetical protein